MTVPEEFCWTWGEFREFNAAVLCEPNQIIHYTRSKMSLHAGARNFLAKERRGNWLFMADADVMLEPDTLFKMLTLQKKYHLPVLTGIVRHKALPHHPLLWLWSVERDGFVPIVEHDPSVQVFKIDATGGGCLLIASEVLDQLAWSFPNEEPFDHIGRYSEDLSFCLRLRRLGISLYATPCVQATHLMVRGITDDDYVEGWWEAQTLEVACGREQNVSRQ